MLHTGSIPTSSTPPGSREAGSSRLRLSAAADSGTASRTLFQFVATNGKTLTLGEMRSCLLVEHQAGIGKLNLPDASADPRPHQYLLRYRVEPEPVPRTVRPAGKLRAGLPGFTWILELPRIPERTRLIDAAIRLGGLEIMAHRPGWPGRTTAPTIAARCAGAANWRKSIERRESTCSTTAPFGMHSRVLECMASGGVIAVNHTDFGRQGQDIGANFEEGKHHIRYDFDNVDAVLAQYAADPQRLAAIRREAAKAVSAKHLWEPSHRHHSCRHRLALTDRPPTKPAMSALRILLTVMPYEGEGA